MVTPVGTVRAVIVHAPPAVIVSPLVQVIAPEVGLFTTHVPIFLPAKLTVWFAVPVSWLGLELLGLNVIVPVVWVMVTSFWKIRVGLLTPLMVHVPVAALYC